MRSASLLLTLPPCSQRRDTLGFWGANPCQPSLTTETGKRPDPRRTPAQTNLLPRATRSCRRSGPRSPCPSRGCPRRGSGPSAACRLRPWHEEGLLGTIVQDQLEGELTLFQGTLAAPVGVDVGHLADLYGPFRVLLRQNKLLSIAPKKTGLYYPRGPARNPPKAWPPSYTPSRSRAWGEEVPELSLCNRRLQHA